MVNCVSKIFLSREDNALFFILMLQFSSNNGRWGTRGGHCQWRGGGVDWSKSWLKPKLNCFTRAKAKVHLFVTRWKSCPSRTRWWPALRRGTSETRESRNHVDIKFNFRLQLVISSLRGDGIDPEELLSRCRQLFSSYFSPKFANDPFSFCLQSRVHWWGSCSAGSEGGVSANLFTTKLKTFSNFIIHPLYYEYLLNFGKILSNLKEYA